MREKNISRALVFCVVAVLLFPFALAATLTCQQVSSSQLSIPQFSTKTVEITCTASGGSVTSAQIVPNANPSTGVTITASQAMSSSISDSSSSTAKWSVKGDTPGTYTISYTVTSSATNAWADASTTTQAVVAAPAQLTVEYVLPPSMWDDIVTDTLDFKISNIGGTTANNVKMRLYMGTDLVYGPVSYPTTISAGASASYAWTNETGFNESGTYTTKVYIGDVYHSEATVSVLRPEDSRNLTLGYHLISLRRVPQNTSTAAVLASLSGKYQKMWAWNTSATTWNAWDVSVPDSFRKVKRMNITLGYWIKLTDAGAELNESGTEPSGSYEIPLVTGYNLIGYPSTTVMNVSVGYASISGNFVKVWKWNATAGSYRGYDPALAPSFNTAFGDLRPGEGYWVKMSSPDTLVIS